MKEENVYASRLLKLANLLERLPKSRFDYSSWVGDDWKGKPDLKCGTKACALGWATTIPEFRHLGLKLVKRYGDDEWADVVIEPKLSDAFPLRRYNADAAQILFDLNYEESRSLFIPDEVEAKVGPKYVASKIRSLVEKKWGVVETKKKKRK